MENSPRKLPKPETGEKDDSGGVAETAFWPDPGDVSRRRLGRRIPPMVDGRGREGDVI